MKNERQSRILEIIQREDIDTQEMLLDRLEKSGSKEKVWKIFVRPEMLSKAVGQKRENIRWLAAMGYEVEILPDPSMPAEDPFWIKEVKHCI